MARIVALVPDLMFASKVEGVLGRDYEVATTKALAPEQLSCDLVIVDLASGLVEIGDVADVLARADSRPKVLGFFAHVEPEVRQRALDAGFDLVVPRSRMAREMPQLVEALLGQ